MSEALGLIFWDLDGTLIDSVPLKGELFARVFDDHPGHHDDLVAFHLDHGGLNRTEKIRRMSTEVLGIPADEAEIERRVSRFGELTDRHLREAPLAPGASATLQELARSSVMHIVTAMPHDEARPILEHHGIAAYFESITGFPVRKAEAVEAVLSGYDARPPATLIGDSREDASTAQRSGISFIQVRLDDAAHLPGAALVLDGLEDAAARIRHAITSR